MGKADRISVTKKVRHAPLAEQIESEDVVTGSGRVKNRRKKNTDDPNDEVGHVLFPSCICIPLVTGVDPSPLQREGADPSVRNDELFSLQYVDSRLSKNILAQARHQQQSLEGSGDYSGSSGSGRKSSTFARQTATLGSDSEGKSSAKLELYPTLVIPSYLLGSCCDFFP